MRGMLETSGQGHRTADRFSDHMHRLLAERRLGHLQQIGDQLGHAPLMGRRRHDRATEPPHVEARNGVLCRDDRQPFVKDLCARRHAVMEDHRAAPLPTPCGAQVSHRVAEPARGLGHGVLEELGMRIATNKIRPAGPRRSTRDFAASSRASRLANGGAMPSGEVALRPHLAHWFGRTRPPKQPSRNVLPLSVTHATSVYRIAADIGGTFTDIALLTGDGHLSSAKLLSTPANYADAVIDGVVSLVRRQGLDIKDIFEVLHGCTVATNTILERKGARTALVTTHGFRDVLELRRVRVPRLYAPLWRKPLPLVPRKLRFEAMERIGADGSIVRPLEESSLDAVIAALREARVEAVAVCLINAFANPSHEQRIGERLRAELPACFISLSTEVLPQIREYERTSTTVVNAYVGPPVKSYLSAMIERLASSGVRGRLLVMQSSGGVLSADAVLDRPAQIVECGPAAGVIGARHLGRQLGYDNVITFDMGGTTAKASLIERGRLSTSEQYEVGASMSATSPLMGGAGYALKLPVIDVSEVGAGGGSIVRIDSGGAIKVGPESAGAVPGPACYGRGGTEPTITDADVVLGYLNPKALAGGSVPIDADAALKAIRERIATPLGRELVETAYGIHLVANTNMMRALKAVSTNRGRDTRDFVMFAFGGLGGVHAASLARELRIGRIVVPPAAGVFSALGLLFADLELNECRACLRGLD